MRMIHTLLIGSVMLSPLFAGSNEAKEDKGIPKDAEIVMDEIQIEGRVEKPNVTILPSRETVQFEESKFPQRSFSSELIKLPPKHVLFDKSFGQVSKVADRDALLQSIIAGQK